MSQVHRAAQLGAGAARLQAATSVQTPRALPATAPVQSPQRALASAPAPSAPQWPTEALALPKDYDGPIFVSDIDQTLRDTKIWDLISGKTQEPLPGSKELLQMVANKNIPILYLSAGPQMVRYGNTEFLKQLPKGALVDRNHESFWSSLFSANHAKDQALYKAQMLGELKRAYPKAQLFGLGDNKAGDASAYTAQGVKAYIRDFTGKGNHLPGNFSGTLLKSYTPELQAQVARDLDAAIASSRSRGGQPPPDRWMEETSATLDRLTGTRATSGNHLDALVDGENVFPEVLKTINGAKKSLYFQTFILHENHKTSDQIVDALIAAKNRGVAVRVVVDAVGAWEIRPLFKNTNVDRLRANGVDVYTYSPVKSLFDIRNAHSDHSKSIIADNQTAWFGGMNVGDEYMGQPAPKRYHDTFAKLEGPAVREVLKDFYEVYAESGGPKIPEAEKVIPPMQTGRGPGTRMRFISHDPKDPEYSIRNTYLTLIDAARERVNIETPYFLADDIVTALAAAARRGVEVNLITDQGKGFHVPVARKDYQKLLDAGVHIYEYPGLVHTKSMSVDGKFATVGSPNFDNISMDRNREVISVIEDPDWVRKYDEELFKDDMGGDEQGNATHPLTKIEMPLWKRVAHWIIQWLWPDWAE